MSTQNPTTVMVTDKAETAVAGFQQKGAREQLCSWIMEHVTEWEMWRKQNLDWQWAEFLRKWRGVYDESDRTRASERSRLISPALQQAVEEAVAEMEEAVLGDKEGWFDIDDNFSDGQKEDWQPIRLQLLDDMDYANVPGALTETCGLMAAVYGTAIGKIVTDIHTVRKLKTVLVPEKEELQEGYTEDDKVVVFLEPVRPDQFVIDTAVNKPGVEGIKQALGMAHRLPRPRHSLREKMEDEIYWEVPLDGDNADIQGLATEAGNLKTSDSEDANLVTEYHGLVPRAILEAAVKDSDAVDEIDTRDMVEAVCTLVDDKYCVLARENENLKKDRDFIAAPHDIIPGSFWGRGVAEKGINSQKALDAMLRAQIDGLGYTVHPMLGVNTQRRDPRHKVEVAPGKVLYSNGDPRETFFPMNFGRIDPTTFTASGELERLIQIATGTAGTSLPARASRSNSTLGGASMIQGGLAKRYKRTLRLMERHFLIPLVEKFCWRHMQYNDTVYPFIDLRFRVRTAMSLVAREAENQTLTQLLQTVPPESPAFYALLGQIIDNTSLKDKGMVKKVVDMVMSGQMPGSAADKQNQPDPVAQARGVADLQEVRARTRMKDASAVKTLLSLHEHPQSIDTQQKLANLAATRTKTQMQTVQAAKMIHDAQNPDAGISP